MDLWVRSQKNDAVGITPRLIKAKSIMLDYEGENDNYYILVNDIEVGYYHSEKKALEVLDEIQKMLLPIMVFENCTPDEKIISMLSDRKIDFVMSAQGGKVTTPSSNVYEMPKE